MRIGALTKRGLVLAIVCLGLGISGVRAQSAGPEALLAQRMAMLDERLQLDDRQAAGIAEIQKRSFYELALIIEEVRASGNKLERLSLMRDAAQLRESMRGQMAPILSPQQLAEFDVLLEEEKSALRAQLTNKR